MRVSHDDLYARPRAEIPPFRFDDHVADVFPDMIRRSVPGYGLTLAMLGPLAAEYAQPGSRVYDLGCSLGAAALAMRPYLPADCRLVAVDNARPMIQRCRQNLRADPHPAPVDLLCADIRHLSIANASLVVLNFTLQFIPPAERLALLRAIRQGLRPGGVVAIAEKIHLSETQEPEFIRLHHAFKRANGYSELEVSQKRSALEAVLVPESVETHQARLAEAGFARSAVWFQCLNFAALLAWESGPGK